MCGRFFMEIPLLYAEALDLSANIGCCPLHEEGLKVLPATILNIF